MQTIKLEIENIRPEVEVSLDATAGLTPIARSKQVYIEWLEATVLWSAYG